MSKNEYYNPPQGPPPTFSQNEGGYAPQSQPQYNADTQDRGFGYHHQQGYGQGAYYQQPAYPPPGGYYQQQQPVYVQQQPTSNNDDCLMACLATMCVCCALDAIF